MNDTEVAERVAGSDGKSYPASYVAHREAIRKAIDADPYATNTAIAKRLGAARDTVIDVRRKMPREFGRVAIADIRVGARHRKDYGDIDGLAENIREVGLLHPPVVTPDFDLIAGERRLMACTRLKWNDVPVRILNLQAILLGEYGENEFRKDFTVSERVAIGHAIELQLGERRGRPTQADDEISPKSDELERGERTDEVAAKRAGFGGKSAYREAKQVVAHGTPELIDAMDAGRASIHAASAIATVPQEEQREIIARNEGEILLAAKEIRARKRAEAPEPVFATSDTPAFDPPTKPLTNNQRKFRVTEALRTLAETDVRPAELRGLMKPFEYPAVDDFIGDAVRYVNELEKVWGA